MPEGMSGIDLAREVRRKRRDIAVLLTSGYTAQCLAQDPELEEEFRILRKPYRQEVLAAGLRAVLDARASADARPRDQLAESAGVLADARVLVVEDDMLQALLLKTQLGALGCETIGPIARLKDALEVAQREPLDGALLDMN